MDPRDRLTNLGIFAAAAIVWVLVAIVVTTRDPVADPIADFRGAGLIGLAVGLTTVPIWWLVVFGRHRRISYRGDWARPSAWSFLNETRKMNLSDTDSYVTAIRNDLLTTAFQEQCNEDIAAKEKLFLGLRRKSGLNLRRYEREFGFERTERIRKHIAENIQTGLFSLDNGQLCLTPRGMLLANDAIVRLINHDSAGVDCR